MRLYQWKARSSSGKAYNGEYYAENEQQVIDFVHQTYGFVTSIENKTDFTIFHRWFQSQPHYSNKERANFYKQLSTLLAAGIPIANAIKMLDAGLSEKFKPVCHRLDLSLQSGHTLSQAMSLQPETFYAMNITVVEAGEVSGQIIWVLQSLSEIYKRRDQLFKVLRNVCIYPAILVVTSIFAFIFFSIELVPSFAEMYHSLGVKETSLLQMMLSFSSLLQNHAVALSCVCIAGGKCLLLKRKKILHLIMCLPGIRIMRRSFLEVRFARLLALLIRSGISFPDAILRSASSLADPVMESYAKKFSDNVLRGIGITDAAVQAGTLFSKTGIEFLRIGESSGNLPDMLEEFAKIQEQELFAHLRDLKAVLEPALVVTIAVMIFGVMSIMLSPLFTLMTQMPDY